MPLGAALAQRTAERSQMVSLSLLPLPSRHPGKTWEAGGKPITFHPAEVLRVVLAESP